VKAPTDAAVEQEAPGLVARTTTTTTTTTALETWTTYGHLDFLKLPLLHASTVVKAAVMYCFLALLSICVSLKLTHTVLFYLWIDVCIRKMPRNTLAMANLARANPSTTTFFL